MRRSAGARRHVGAHPSRALSVTMGIAATAIVCGAATLLAVTAGCGATQGSATSAGAPAAFSSPGAVTLSAAVPPARAVVAGRAILPASKYRYTILAANDLGMHCIQPDYSAMMILPPANFLHVQVFRKGGEGASLIRSGIRVTYAVQNMEAPQKALNFWTYASSYGFNLAPGVGITGNKLSGRMKLSADRKFWEATAIPAVPRAANGSFNAYPTAKITVTNTKGKVLAVLPKVVIPVSDEMHCDNCHPKPNTFQAILGTHDKLSGTTLAADLAAGKRHACNECHSDPILSAAGKPGVKSLSEAMHGFHADKMNQSALANPCYNCHPGLVTQCLRGAMARQGITCTNVNCHGTVANVAATIVNGRVPWVNEPDCGNCHANAANPNKLYRQSYLSNGPENMNGFILCESCHNGTHAEWRTSKAIDAAVPRYLEGDSGPIHKCKVCHQGSGKIHGGGGGG
jgi:predicted CxxxxCH...CXXCH cytochrome family protein